MAKKTTTEETAPLAPSGNLSADEARVILAFLGQLPGVRPSEAAAFVGIGQRLEAIANGG